MDEAVVVKKLNLQGEETWRYEGRVVQQRQNGVLLEAFFNRPDLPFHGIVFAEGDRFLEAYWSDRWYNIFEIHSRVDDTIKGWYCNVSQPAQIKPGVIGFVDLALDLLVYPDGRWLILDEDEFRAMGLDAAVSERAVGALNELQEIFTAHEVFSVQAFFDEGASG